MFINENKKNTEEILKEVINNTSLSEDAKIQIIQALKEKNNKEKEVVEGLEEGDILINEG